MVKISPVLNVKFNNTPSIAKQIVSDEVKMPEKIKVERITHPFGNVIPYISTLLHDFNQTVCEGNYFQLGINPETGKVYEPDIFQKTAGINLYLGNDVLVTAPTGTGKTAIAEYIITKNLNEIGKTFYTTPLKALSNEKYREFCKIYGKENVGLITGDTKINTGAPVIVMTTEVYRNMAVANNFNFDMNSYKGLPDELKTVIFDELQYLGDVDRGGIWEQSIMFTPKDVQMLSLSATIGNNEEINNWIASIRGRQSTKITPVANYLPENYTEKETVLVDVPAENRHVPLKFSTASVITDFMPQKTGSKRELSRQKMIFADKADSMYAKPSKETYKYLTQSLYGGNKLPAIYFVFSKKEGREIIKYLSDEGIDLNDYSEKKEIKKIIENYKNQGIYLGESLNIAALFKGYAIHNAGMLPSQKQLIEELFQKKLVKVVVATETLSAGINMPARTTVISSPRKPASTSDGNFDNKRNLTPNEFHQMAGRAGRRGIDTTGYCYPLSCNLEQTSFYNNLIRTPSNPLYSNLEIDYSFIASYAAEFNNDTQIEEMLAKSLYAHTQDGRIDVDKLENLMKKYRIKKEILSDNEYIDEYGNLLIKGKMLKALNGYEQIPIINILTSSELENLTVPQLAGIIGGLANIQTELKTDLTLNDLYEKNPFEIYDTAYIKEFQDILKELKRHEREIFDINPEKILHIDKNISDHVYKWAQLNETNENSRENWHELYKGILNFSIKDEGSLFKEISAAADLTKQLYEACKIGIKESETQEETKRYKKLSEKFSEILKTIQKEPVNSEYT